ncbi:hypothetical protein TELCIR_06015, partial [Teladorsagia circumcincta]
MSEEVRLSFSGDILPKAEGIALIEEKRPIDDGTQFRKVQAQCLPLDLRGDRRAIKLIQERKRKLFHSQVYENEIGMKRLYIQTAKKLAAFGCKVFQVKELLHGRTLRKTLRLLCLSSASLCLLEGTSKLVLKRQHASTLQQWRVGGG